MVSKLSIALLFLLIIPGVIATDTVITIKTDPGMNVTVNVLNTNNGDSIQSFSSVSDTTGNAVITATTGASIVDLAILVRDNGRLVTLKEFKGYSTGVPVFIDLTAAPVVPSTPVVENITPIVNETPIVNDTPIVVPETAPDTEVVDSSANKVSGNVAKNSIFSNLTNINFSNKTVYFIIYVIAGILGLFLILKFGVPMFRKDPAYHYEKLKINSSDYGPQAQVPEPILTSAQIKEAEDKVREYEAKLDKIKKIQDTENKIRASQEELNRLRSEN